MHRVTQLGSIQKRCWCYLYLKYSKSRLDGDLSEPRTGGGGGGGHSGILILSNIEAWPIFFLADLQKWMVGLCSL